jgi:hypothetical protein
VTKRRKPHKNPAMKIALTKALPRRAKCSAHGNPRRTCEQCALDFKRASAAQRRQLAEEAKAAQAEYERREGAPKRARPKWPQPRVATRYRTPREPTG